ncbi:MAG: polyprenol monophosphomannose synthase, partial [Acidimicrobiales bacterium]
YPGGYTLWASSLLAAMDLERLQATGYGCQIELKSRALALSDRVREVPIVFMDRRVGESKIPKSTIFKNLVLVPRIRFVDRPSKAPLPVVSG